MLQAHRTGHCRGTIAFEMPDSAADEKALVRRSRKGDLEAFEMLYRTHMPRVYGLCLRMTGDPARSEDLTQEIFIRAWQKLSTFAGRSAFGTWLYRLGINSVLGELRARGGREDRETSIEEPSAVAVRQALGEPQAEPPIDLERAILKLPERARLVFLLHDVEGYRHGEVAALTGMAEGTSKAHLHRARRLLRQELER